MATCKYERSGAEQQGAAISRQKKMIMDAGRASIQFRVDCVVVHRVALFVGLPLLPSTPWLEHAAFVRLRVPKEACTTLLKSKRGALLPGEPPSLAGLAGGRATAGGRGAGDTAAGAGRAGEGCTAAGGGRAGKGCAAAGACIGWAAAAGGAGIGWAAAAGGLAAGAAVCLRLPCPSVRAAAAAVAACQRSSGTSTQRSFLFGVALR